MTGHYLKNNSKKNPQSYPQSNPQYQYQSQSLDNSLQSATPKFNRVLNQPADVIQEGEEQ